jgi:hypothetical protein
MWYIKYGSYTVTVIYGKLFCRAVDPDSMNPDPDTAFQVNQDPDTDPDTIRIQGFDVQKLKKKNTSEFFFIKNCNLLMSKLQ